MTIGEISLIINVHQEKQKTEAESQVQLAIINAYYTVALDRSKKLPKLNSLLNMKKSKKSSDEDLFNKIKNMNALFGGQVTEKGG